MSGPENPENKWGGEGQSDPTRIIPNPIPQAGQQPGGQQPFNPPPWSQSPAPGQPAAPPPPPQQGAWGQQPPPQTPAWGIPSQPPPPGQPGQPAWGQPPQAPPTQQSWAAPGQQPWQQPGQPAQPEYGQFPQSTGQSKSKLPLILGIVALVVLLIGGGLAAAFFLNRSSTLDEAAVEGGVTDVLTNSYGLQGVSGVECPAGQKVETGTTFTCNVTVDGEGRIVTVRIIDDEGTYEVSKPQ